MILLGILLVAACITVFTFIVYLLLTVIIYFTYYYKIRFLNTYLSRKQTMTIGTIHTFTMPVYSSIFFWGSSPISVLIMKIVANSYFTKMGVYDIFIYELLVLLISSTVINGIFTITLGALISYFIIRYFYKIKQGFKISFLLSFVYYVASVIFIILCLVLIYIYNHYLK